MTWNKKGVFFTFIAITLMALFILLFTPSSDIPQKNDEQSTQTRVALINDYMDDLQNGYMMMVMSGSAYKSIVSLVFYMNQTGSYLGNFNDAMYEVMLNGTINNVQIDIINGKKIMENNTLKNWTSKISKAALDTLGVNTTIAITNVSFYQIGPWELHSRMQMRIIVNSTVADWEKSENVEGIVPIEGFYDPYYLLNSNGRYASKIKRSSVNFNKWTIAKVREHLRNTTYVHWEYSEAPSFIMRFTNNMQNSSCCGIESLVDPNKISPSDTISSYVDYLYFTNKFTIANCTQLFNITNPPSSQGLWDEFSFFKIDFDHVARYNITAADRKKTC